MNEGRSTPEAVVFDAVGTVIFPREPVSLTYARTAARHGVRISRELIERRFRDAFRDIFISRNDPVTSDQLERSRWQELVLRVIGDGEETAAIFEELWHHYSRAGSWNVYPEVAAVFDRLRKAGIRIAIGSNFDERLKAICKGHVELDKAEAVFCSSEIGFCKPDARFFQKIADRLDCHPSKLLMIGDDPDLDVAGALAAGWQARHLERRKTDLSASTADLP